MVGHRTPDPTTRRMRILLTGGTGFIGRASADALLRAGHEVRVLARDATRANDALAGVGPVEIATGQPIDRSSVLRALEGRDGLVHAAATYSYKRRDRQRMLVETPALARSVLGAALDAGTPHVVDVSSTVVFSIRGPRIDETTPLTRAGVPEWADPYLQAKVLAELAGRELEGQGLPRVAVHPTTTVGPEDRGPGTSGSLLVRLLRGGTFPRGQLGWVDVREVASAIVAALEARPGSRYILSGVTEPFDRVATRLDGLTGRRRARWFPGRSVLGTLARLNDRLGAPVSGLTPAANLEYIFGCPPVIDGSRAERDLDIRYRDLDETLADAIRWWSANGTISRAEAGRLATTGG